MERSSTQWFQCMHYVEHRNTFCKQKNRNNFFLWTNKQEKVHYDNIRVIKSLFETKLYLRKNQVWKMLGEVRVYYKILRILSLSRERDPIKLIPIKWDRQWEPDVSAVAGNWPIKEVSQLAIINSKTSSKCQEWQSGHHYPQEI